MGIPEYEANRYEGRIKEGGILLSVHADDNDWKNKAKDILERTGAEDIGYKGESGSDYDINDRPGSKDTNVLNRTSDGELVEPKTGDPVNVDPGGPIRER